MKYCWRWASEVKNKTNWNVIIRQIHQHKQINERKEGWEEGRRKGDFNLCDQKMVKNEQKHEKLQHIFSLNIFTHCIYFLNVYLSFPFFFSVSSKETVPSHSNEILNFCNLCAVYNWLIFFFFYFGKLRFVVLILAKELERSVKCVYGVRNFFQSPIAFLAQCSWHRFTFFLFYLEREHNFSIFIDVS